MTSPALRARFWAELILAALTGVLAVGTMLWHYWIEAVTGLDPDAGNGSAEWLVVAALAVVTLALAAGARHEWRRARRATGTA